MASSEAAGTPAPMQDSRQHAAAEDFDTHHRTSTPGRHARGRHASSPAQGSRGNRGGRVGRFESRSQQPGRWGHRSLPEDPVLPDNARQFGVVVTVKETFGFIKCYTGRRDQVFFHASELQAPAPQQPPAGDAPGGNPDALDHSTSQQQQQQQQQQQHGRGRPDLPSMVAPGTPVEFTVIEGDPQQKRRTVAVQVKVLPPFMDTLQRGTVERDLRGGQRRQEDGYGGRITWQPPAPLPPAPASPGGSQHGAHPAAPTDVRKDVGRTPPPSPRAAAAAAAAEAALAGTGIEVHGLPPGLGQVIAANGSLNHDGVGLKSPRSGAAAGGDAISAKQQPEADKPEQESQALGLPFEGVDLAAPLQRLHVGDEVEFRVALDRRLGQLKATEVTLVKSAHPEAAPAAASVASSRPSTITTSGARENGYIATLRDNFGFLMCADRDVRLFFHFSEVGFPKGALAEGAEVSFSAAADEESGRESAVALQLLPLGTIAAAADTPLPEPVRGRVVRPALEPRGRQVQDGVAAFVDSAGLEFHCAYGNHQLPEGAQHPAEGDELLLSVVHNRRTGARRASEVTLVARAADRRQLGQVKVLKNNWGLIRAVERPTDVFFHFSNLVDVPEGELKVGDDVEFTLVRDSQAAVKDGGAKKLAAVRITRAPPGSAVFESLSEEALEGRVVERLQVQRGATVAPGAVEYTDSGGATCRLAFGVHDLTDAGINPSVGEPVAFRLAVNHAAVKAAAGASGLAAAHAGRRATQVGPPAVEATVASVNQKGGFGFANVDAAGAAKLGLGEHTRMSFHTAEVEEGVRLARGDVVSMVVTFNPRTGERGGQRVRLLRQGSKDAEKPEFVAERNPNAVRYIGNRAEVQPLPQPKMPDGTRGFEPGAWCERRLPLRPTPLPASTASSADQQPPAAQPPTANGTAQRQPSPSLQHRHQQQQQQQRQQRVGIAPPRPPLPVSSAAAAAPRQMMTAFAAAAASAAEPPPQQGASPPPPGPSHQRRLSSSRLGSGLLKADAPEFVPRLGSQGSLASELGVFLTPAASLSELGASQLPQLPASRGSAPDLRAAAMAAAAAAAAGPFASADEQLAGIRSVDSSFTAPSDSSAFFTPAASLAVAGLEAAGLQPAQLQAVAAQLERADLDGSSAAAADNSPDGGPGAKHPTGSANGSAADDVASAPAADAAVESAAPPGAASGAGHAPVQAGAAAPQAVSAAADAAAEADVAT